jgi:hypothetical protein
MLLAQKFFNAACVVQIAIRSIFLHQNWKELEIDEAACATPTAPRAWSGAGHPFASEACRTVYFWFALSNF